MSSRNSERIARSRLARIGAAVFGAWLSVLAMAPSVRAQTVPGPATSPSAASAPAAVEPPQQTTGGEQQSVPIASAVHAESQGDAIRLVFDLSAAVAAKAFVLADPKRVVVDLPQVDFEIDPRVGEPQPVPSTAAHGLAKTLPSAVGQKQKTLIAAYRFGSFAPGRSRIVIDLEAAARVAAVEYEPSSGNGQRLVVELVPTDEASFAAAARQAQAENLQPTAEAAPTATQNASNKPIVVLDPGHGGLDTGAIGGKGIVEKQIVLDFAKELAAKLEASGHYKVVMTRSTDVFVPLAERVHMARDSNAALFISVHADDLLDGGSSVSGATVYTASDKASDAQAAKLAETENKADAAGGVSRQDDPSDVSDILLDLTRRETRAYSNVFARTLVNYWKVAARLNKNPHRSAGFVVLKAPDVPSVLLELGYLSSPKDTAELLSSDWRDRATDSVMRSIDGFFAPRQALPAAANAEPAQPAAAATGVAVSQH